MYNECNSLISWYKKLYKQVDMQLKWINQLILDIKAFFFKSKF